MDSFDGYDKLLMKSLQRGTIESFQWIYERHKQKVYNYCLQIIGNKADALEATEFIFKKFCKKMYTYDPSRKFVICLLMLVRDQCRSYLKSNGIKIYIRTFTSKFKKSKTDSIRIDFLTKLPLLQKEAIILKEYHQLNYEDVGRILRCSAGKVRETVYKARINILQRVEKAPALKIVNPLQANMRKLISSYVDKEATNEEQNQVEQALATSKEDLAYYNWLVQLTSMMGLKMNTSVPPELDLILSSCFEQVTRSQSPAKKPNIVVPVFQLLVLTAVALFGTNYLYDIYESRRSAREQQSKSGNQKMNTNEKAPIVLNVTMPEIQKESLQDITQAALKTSDVIDTALPVLQKAAAVIEKVGIGKKKLSAEQQPKSTPKPQRNIQISMKGMEDMKLPTDLNSLGDSPLAALAESVKEHSQGNTGQSTQLSKSSPEDIQEMLKEKFNPQDVLQMLENLGKEKEQGENGRSEDQSQQSKSTALQNTVSKGISGPHKLRDPKQKAKNISKSLSSNDINQSDSYNRIKYFLSNNYMPDQDIIQIEEMVNYFNYENLNTSIQMPFSISIETSQCPWEPDNYVVLLQIKALKRHKYAFDNQTSVVASDINIHVAFNEKMVSKYRAIFDESNFNPPIHSHKVVNQKDQVKSGFIVTELYEISPNYKGFDINEKEKELIFAQNTDLTDFASFDVLAVSIKYTDHNNFFQTEFRKVLSSDDFKSKPNAGLKFASAVAEFGLILKNSIHKGQATYDQVIQSASQSNTHINRKIQKEFLQLVEKAKSLDQRP